jgi:hypothetical protein
MATGPHTPSSPPPGTDPCPRPFTAPDVADLAERFFPLEILGLLGRGGMGAVYKARQPDLDRLVALKILPPEAGSDPAFTERFTREARALARLNHPNIVTVYDFGRKDGLYYFLMEYVDGQDLRSLLRSAKLPPEEALKVTSQVCDGLQFAHDEGIVHRDVKPENLLLDKRGRVKIADFGLAKLLRGQRDEYTLTGPWQVMGTPHYMAPEQLDDPLGIDHRADLYALGVVLCEMLTGRLPRGRFALPSQTAPMDARIDAVVARALESEPAKRYQHAAELKADLEALRRGAPPEAATREPAPDGADTDAVRRQVKGPAVALAATGVLNWLGMIAIVAALALTSRLHAAILPVALSLAAASALLLFCSFRLMALQSYGLAWACAVLAMLVGPGYLVGWPAGIWTMVVLARPDVRAAFRRKRERLGRTSRRL